MGSNKPRGRSNSLSSLFRVPFEVRRASIDTDTGDGFIGGVKLEQHRLAAQQKALEDQAAEARKAVKKTRQRSESPLRFLVPRSEPKESRAYPPISLQTTGNQERLYQDDSMMQRWKARVGMRSGSREPPLPRGAQKLTKTPTAQRPKISAPIVASSSTTDVTTNSLHISGSQSTPNFNSPTLVQRIHGPVDDEKMAMLTVDPATHPIFNGGSPGNTSEGSYTTVPESPPPPPRRSSKRKSIVNTEASASPLTQVSSENLPPAEVSAEVQERPKRWTMSDPPSIPYDSVSDSRPASQQQQRKTFRQAARAAFGSPTAFSPPVMPAAVAERPASRSRSPTGTTRTLRSTDERVLPADKYNRLKATFVKHRHRPSFQDSRTSFTIGPPSPSYNSSDDSVYDGFRTPGDHGTPDTSRPQSERGGFSNFGDDRKKWRQFPVLPSPAYSIDESRYSNQSSPLELDPIQAAALKVMTAFPDSNTGRNPKPRHGGDERQPPRIDTDVAQEHDPASKSPPLRDLIMARDETSVVVPWPATYLQAARKAAPAAQAPHKVSPLVAPKPLFAPRESIAKMFVECCGCQHLHDMPSKLYETMTNADGVIATADDPRFAGAASLTVPCPWCKHEMGTTCCAGLAATVHVKERLH